jgi:vancomycin resistance protein YoaR
MVTQPISQRPIEFAPPNLPAKIGAAFATAFVAIVLASFIFSTVLAIANLGRVYPGVRMAGVDLSGVRRSEAASLINSQLNYPLAGQVTLTYGERSWQFSPAQLGLRLDAEASSRAAFSIGRSIWPWQAISEKIRTMREGVNLAPRLIFDGQASHQALQQLANEINQPTVEAVLAVNGLEVQVTAGQVGLTLDTEQTANFLAALLIHQQNITVPLAVVEQPPRILDVSAQAAIAEGILTQPLSINPGGNYQNNPDPLILQPETLATMLSIERIETETSAQYQIGLEAQELGALLAGFASQVAAQPENARFFFNDETRQLEVVRSAVVGRSLNLPASVEHINQQLALGAHQIDVQYDFTNPEILDDARAEDLGIRELVSQQTTYFNGSSDARIQNIITAASRFHGLLVPPQAVFSMVDNIGDISLDSGFAEALIIFGDRTIKGVGGGVCQVSTTLFRTVFFGGFPIVERYPHAYRVGYYEINPGGPNLVGLDATVYAPIVDFKFQNDTDNWLLMETYVDGPGRTITWKFYSTSDGRTVDWDTTGVRNVVDALDPVYEENPELSKGEVKQVDYAAEGADVSITRWVTRNGAVIYEDVINTHYEAWAAVYQYGPGTPNMPPKNLNPQNNNN